MKEQRSTFQTIVFIVFAAFIVIAVLVFAGLSGGGGSGSEDIGEVVVWGTFDEGMMESYLNVLKDEDERIGGVIYQELNPEIYDARLTEAIANGRGPDLFILDQSRIIEHESKIIPISFERVSERVFKDTFIDQGEMFIGANGIIGMPWSIDPLVLYWNRDYFAQSGFSQPPVYWDEIFAMAERMTERDSANTVVRSTIAFGEYSNVEHAKDVIATLMLQAGGQIVARERDGTLLVRVAPNRDAFRSAVSPAQSALRFYTEFADPVKSVYSWNRSLPNSLDAFAQGRLALYVGRASDIDRIQAKNGNLNFDVAPLPQIRAGETTQRVVFGTLHALAVPRTSFNPVGAAEVAIILSSERAAELFAEFRGLPSPRRDLLGREPSDPVALIFRNAALISRAWFDPDVEETNDIFRRMIGDVTSGALRISDTLQRTDQELVQLVGQQ